jgi:ABC-type Co2+ transport system permease subunit
MASVSTHLGSVTDGLTVQMAQTKLIALLNHVKIKDYGIVAMASVSQRAMFVMAQVNLAMLDGALTVLMEQTRL